MVQTGPDLLQQHTARHKQRAEGAVDIASGAINRGNVVAGEDPAGLQTSKTNFQKLSA